MSRMMTMREPKRKQPRKQPRIATKPRDEAEHQARLDMVEAMLISGARVRQVEAQCAAAWGVQKRRARDFIAEVRQRWGEAAKTDPETLEERRAGIVRTVRDVMYRALSDDDLARALTCTQQLALLEGVSAPQKLDIRVSKVPDAQLPIELARALRDVMCDASEELRAAVRGELREVLAMEADALSLREVAALRACMAAADALAAWVADGHDEAAIALADAYAAARAEVGAL